MDIAIDLGNTFAKLGVFSDQKLHEVYNRLTLAEVLSLIREKNPGYVIVSSVNQDPQKVRAALPQGVKSILLSHETPLPIHLSYRTPSTLGMDRLAAVVGAYDIYPAEAVLVIDAGTCITYDFLDGRHCYHGGGISPGIHMKFKALNTFTASLPLITEYGEAELVGDSTENAIKSGVINGTVAEIWEIIRMYNNKFGNLRVVMCGGDAKFLGTKLQGTVSIYPHLVLRGLNRILIHNV